MNNLLPTLLLVLFIALKLTNYIAWSWWWVLSPLWIPVALWIALTLGILLVGSLGALGLWLMERV